MDSSKISQFEMNQEDLLGYSPDDVACISCRPLCTNKVMRRFNGGPLFMCTRKETTKEVLAAEAKRAQQAGGIGTPGARSGHVGPGTLVPPPGQKA